MPGVAHMTCRNLRMCGWRAGKKKPNDCKNKDAGAGRVEAIREAVHEAVGEVVAGGSSIRLLIRVHCAPGRLEKDQSSNC